MNVNPRHILPLLAILAGLLLTACASPLSMTPGRGPGALEAEACEASPAVPPDNAGDVAQAAAAARNGQDASSQPVQTDPARIQPTTVWNRGSGPNVNAPASSENRSQAGAPAVNQGLVFPATAMASVDSASRAAVTTLQESLRQLLAEYGKATDPAMKAQLWAAVDATMNRLENATARAAGAGGDTYNLQGARIVQVVANGSKSGDAPGGSMDPATAKSIGENAADLVRNVIGGDAPPEPAPAGAIPPVPAVEGGTR